MRLGLHQDSSAGLGRRRAVVALWRAAKAEGPEKAGIVSRLTIFPSHFDWREVFSAGLGSPALRQARMPDATWGQASRIGGWRGPLFMTFHLAPHGLTSGHGICRN
jgi:hypothetical protein